MLIDWFTVGAQALNFVVLVWLLKRFLYRPILAAIDAREQCLVDELTDADAKRDEAAQEKAEFQRRNDALEQQQAALLATATEHARLEGQRLLDAARLAADTLGVKRQAALAADALALTLALRRRTQQEVFAIARRALQDLAGVELEQRMVETFTGRLRALDEQTRTGLTHAATAAAAPALLRSARDLSPQQQDSIRRTLHDTLAADLPLQFETVPGLLAGIELSVNGSKLAWSIDAYLDALEQAVDEVVKGAPA